MSARAGSTSPVRLLVALAAIGAMWWFAFEQLERIPLLEWVNLAMHQGGHMVTYSASDVQNAMAGPIAQVAIPLLFAMYFFFGRGDWIAAGVFLAWAAASAAEVSLFVADAPAQRLDLLGDDKNDWAIILGPDGYGALAKSESLAHTIRDVASVAIVVGALLCLAAPLRSQRRRPHPETMTATRRATATSRY
jgi:hypothetical protein